MERTPEKVVDYFKLEDPTIAWLDRQERHVLEWLESGIPLPSRYPCPVEREADVITSYIRNLGPTEAQVATLWRCWMGKVEYFVEYHAIQGTLKCFVDSWWPSANDTSPAHHNGAISPPHRSILRTRASLTPSRTPPSQLHSLVSSPVLKPLASFTPQLAWEFAIALLSELLPIVEAMRALLRIGTSILCQQQRSPVDENLVFRLIGSEILTPHLSIYWNAKLEDLLRCYLQVQFSVHLGYRDKDGLTEVTHWLKLREGSTFIFSSASGNVYRTPSAIDLELLTTAKRIFPLEPVPDLLLPFQLQCLRYLSLCFPFIGLSKRWFDLSAEVILCDGVETMIDFNCRNRYDVRQLSLVQSIGDIYVQPFLDLVETPEAEELREGISEKVACHTIEFFARVKAAELLDMILDWPLSEPGLFDLKEIPKLDQKILFDELTISLKNRALIPGASTGALLKTYRDAIETLGVIDKSGILASHVLSPLREYLRKRKDTIRCVLAQFTDDAVMQHEVIKDTSMQRHYQIAGRVPISDVQGLSDDEDDEDFVPLPAQVPMAHQSRLREASNQILLLLGIYGSSDLLLREYEILLCERLIYRTGFEVSSETIALELLADKLGAHAVCKLMVMLHDVNCSKQIHSQIMSNRRGDASSRMDTKIVPVSALIYSRFAWPQPLCISGTAETTTDYGAQDDDVLVEILAEPKNRIDKRHIMIQGDDGNLALSFSQTSALPLKIGSFLDMYSKGFSKVRPNQKLLWKLDYGQVEATVTLRSRTVDVVGTPVQLSVLLLFEDNESLTLTDVKTRMTDITKEECVEQALDVWVSQGILYASTRQGDSVSYEVVEDHRDFFSRQEENNVTPTRHVTRRKSTRRRNISLPLRPKELVSPRKDSSKKRYRNKNSKFETHGLFHDAIKSCLLSMQGNRIELDELLAFVQHHTPGTVPPEEFEHAVDILVQEGSIENENELYWLSKTQQSLLETDPIVV